MIVGGFRETPLRFILARFRRAGCRAAKRRVAPTSREGAPTLSADQDGTDFQSRTWEIMG